MKDTGRTFKLTVALEEETHKKLTQLCKIDNRVSFQDFINNSVKHCIEKKILPRINKGTKNV